MSAEEDVSPLGDRIAKTLDRIDRTRAMMLRVLIGDADRGPDAVETVRLGRVLAEATSLLNSQLQNANRLRETNEEALEEALDKKLHGLYRIDSWDKVEALDDFLHKEDIDPDDLEEQWEARNSNGLVELRDELEALETMAEEAKDKAAEVEGKAEEVKTTIREMLGE